MQAWVLLCRIYGKTHREIAAVFGVEHTSIMRAEEAAICKISGVVRKTDL